MGSKTDGFKTDHVLSRCCKEPVRFKSISNGYSLQAWCSKCGNYSFNGRIEALLALWLGNHEAVIKNKGYVPKWVKEKK